MSVKNHSHDRYGKLASEDLVLTDDELKPNFV